MSLLNGYSSRKVHSHIPFDKEFIEIPYSQTEALHSANLFVNENDLQIKKVFDYYGIYDLLKK